MQKRGGKTEGKKNDLYHPTKAKYIQINLNLGRNSKFFLVTLPLYSSAEGKKEEDRQEEILLAGKEGGWG